MKAGLLAITALIASASAQPHRRHQHRRDNAVVWDTEVVKVVVLVDQFGNKISTTVENDQEPAVPPPDYYAPPPSDTYETLPEVPPPAVQNAAPYQAPPPPPPPAAAPAPAPAPAPADSYQAPPQYDYSAPAPYSPPPPAPAPAPAQHESTAPAPYQPPPQEQPPSSAGGQGLTYSPYNPDGTCKSQDQVNADFDKINGLGKVRIYGCDCDQVRTVKNAATAKGMTMFLGIFDINQVQAEVDKIVAAIDGEWHVVDTVAVGNEIVNRGGSVDAVVSAVNQARSSLRAGGYNGPVVAVDTFVAIIAHPEICQASDYAAANIHAFFDGAVAAEDAGPFVLEQSKRVAEACGGKRVVVSESGWPWKGDAHGVAAPSPQNQNAAINSLKQTFSQDFFFFTAFDDLWKTNFAGSQGAECYWGFLEHSQ